MSLELIYATDLHGDIKKYEDVFAYANRYDIKLIHLGADLLPKGEGMLKAQKKFIKGYLKNFYVRCHNEGIKVLAFFGNDDIYTRKKYFIQSIGEYGDLLDEVPFKKKGYSFKAYGYVPDHPFGLKNGVKLDNKFSKPSELYPRIIPTTYEGKIYRVKKLTDPVDVNEKGVYTIDDLSEYFKKKGTIEDDLKNIRIGKKTVMAIHTPPSHVNLDVCPGFRRVGSDSVLHFIEKKQPLCVLSGHIHRCVEMGEWKTYIGKTLVIQPGQADKQTTMVHVEVEDNYVDAQIVVGVKFDWV